VPKLVVMRGGAVQGERPLTGESLRIGRDNQNDVVLSDPAKGVSRFHAEIRAEAGGYTVVDLKSRNGIWVNGKRVTTAALRLATPITLGPYQLSIQEQPLTETFDTLSGDAATIGPDTGRIPAPGLDAGPPPLPDPGAVVLPKAALDAGRSPKPVQADRGSTASNGRLLWGGLTVALLAVSIGAFAILRHRTREAPAPSSPVAGVTLAAPIAPAPADPGARAVKEEEVETAKVALAGAPLRPSPPPERIIAKPAAKPPAPVDAVLVEGIPRAPGEGPGEYNGRAKRVQDNYSRARASLEKKDYHAALDSLSAVEREQPGYQNAGALLSQTRTELHETAREAMDNAAKNEAAGEWYAALQWYQHAEQFESTPELLQRARVAQDRVIKEAYSAFDRANALRKLNETAKAILQYQKVRDWLPPDDEKRQEALKQLQVLKP
jgi:predicted component of type VI protein secretion system